MLNAKTEDAPFYGPTDLASTHQEDFVIAEALDILERRMKRHNTVSFTTPAAAKDFVMLKSAQLEHEVFSILFLDSQHGLIAFEEMFRGTVSQTSVYPREVVKRALALNAAAVIFSHNHPSGLPEPSRADEFLTQTLKKALALVDVRVLDHLVVGGSTVMSFAERGLL